MIALGFALRSLFSGDHFMPIDKSNYAWLDSLGTLPRMIVEARVLVGTLETPGSANNDVIMGWAREIGGPVKNTFTADAVPWCGLFMAFVARKAGKTPPAEPLWALNWGKFGEPAGQPVLGDVLTFIRPHGGHVGLYVGEDSEAYHVISGNVSDQVCFARIEKTRLRAARRPPYMTRPQTAKAYVLAQKGALSANEG
ncbi:TIGR02594 family protein [Sphingomonas faeni]|uniref:TIGR02594 family protein n=1 Tax=Sphingomonas faeni TaxID=185950 RepID=UPI00334CCA15